MPPPPQRPEPAIETVRVPIEMPLSDARGQRYAFHIPLPTMLRARLHEDFHRTTLRLDGESRLETVLGLDILARELTRAVEHERNRDGVGEHVGEHDTRFGPDLSLFGIRVESSPYVRPGTVELRYRGEHVQTVMLGRDADLRTYFSDSLNPQLGLIYRACRDVESRTTHRPDLILQHRREDERG